MAIQLLHESTTYRIIGAYLTAFNRLSQTYPEFIFERAVRMLLERQQIRCICQDEYEIWYKGQIVGLQRLDLFIADEVVVELKVADKILPIHLAQLLSYLKTIDKQVGLLLRFGGPKPDFERRVLSSQLWSETLKSSQDIVHLPSDLLHAELIYEIIGGLLEVFKILGPGFIHRIYANACYRELKLRSLAVMPRREFSVFLDGVDLGKIKLGHLQVNNRVLVFPIAESQVEQVRIPNLKAWMRHLNIPLGVLVNFKTTNIEPIILRL